MIDQLWSWLLVGALAALFNLTPIFAPPTWAMLAYFHIQHDVSFLPTVIAGAVGATTGRVLLALASRKFGPRLIPARRQADLEQIMTRISDRKRLNLPFLALFAAGPVPRSLLFIAVGMARAPLAPVAAVYGLARAAIYGGAVAASGQAAASLGEVVTSPVGGPLLIVAQLASVVGMVLLFRVDLPLLWQRLHAVRGILSRVVRRLAPSRA